MSTIGARNLLYIFFVKKYFVRIFFCEREVKQKKNTF